VKIALLGYGKMGKILDTMALAAGHEVVLRHSGGNGTMLQPQALTGADVAIEFSVPAAAPVHIETCLQAGVPVVCGTTGWLDELDRIKALIPQHQGALVYASNFSVGVNLFFALNRYLAQIMAAHPQYAISMEEIHHTEKLDAPSGTALSLAADIRKQTSNSNIPIVSRREPGVTGTHHVAYSHAIDTLSISHVAHSREGFARGALLAAEWVIGKTGFFEMSDVLQL
jgi:4-hydroxy-tetrahydrodipicolinate reductase